MIRALLAACLPAFLATLAAVPVRAGEEGRGPVTNLPMPRFVSLKADEANARRGPGTDHRIDWVFRRRDMPLRVIGEYSHWRRVADRDGAGGWVHYTLLSGVRTVLVEEDLTPLRARPEPGAPINAYAEAGVIARLGECVPGWCRISVDGTKGWAEAAAIWGEDEPAQAD
ncbi:MAG: SH3 domain-containing protein [Rhodobacteraceae bacterium]|nr:SH3 domain-containing protein [Paracoccaceae bacterium]